MSWYSENTKKIFRAYALCEDGKVETLTEGNKAFKRMVKETMASTIPSQKIREMITAEFMGLIHNPECQGDDSVTPDLLTPYEIKTEQPEKAKMSGESCWSKTDESNMQRYESQTVIQAGFFEGRLAYIASFSIKESGIIDTLRRGYNGTPKVKAISWSKYESTLLHFMNRTYVCPVLMSRDLIKALHHIKHAEKCVIL